MSSEISTYTGVWVNWSHGLVRGTTLTLPQFYGGLLISFLSIFVTFTGGMFWRILSFVIHQRNTTDPSQMRDWLHYERQVLLRNSGTGAGGVAWSLLWLPWSYRGARVGSAARCLPLALLAASTMAVFGIAGVFTSSVTTFPGTTTLIRGSMCGGYKIPPIVGTNVNRDWITKFLADTLAASTYVRQCYGKSPLPGKCGIYVKPRLNFTVSQNASCPFAPGYCKISNTAAFAMDTGLMNSTDDFGINAKPSNKIQYRRLTTCAPINATTFGHVSNKTIEVTAGPALGMNVTFQYSLEAGGNGFGYYLDSVWTPSNSSGKINTTGDWTPVPALKQEHGDMTLMLLAQNDVLYEGPSNDPWMPAHSVLDEDLYPNTFMGDFHLNLLGCVDKYQICNPNRDAAIGCTKLSGALDVLVEFSNPSNPYGINLYQEETIVRFLSTATYRNMNYAIAGRGASALNSQEHMYQNTQGTLPPNQWQKEVTIWFQTCLAKEQAWAVEWATYPRNIDFDLTGKNISFTPNHPEQAYAQQCGDQMIKDASGYLNFSVLGMALIIAIGGLIIIVGMSVDTVVGWFRSMRTRFMKEQWDLEGTLALHKSSYATFVGDGDDWSGKFPPCTVLKRPGTSNENNGLLRFEAVGKAGGQGNDDGAV